MESPTPSESRDAGLDEIARGHIQQVTGQIVQSRVAPEHLVLREGRMLDGRAGYDALVGAELDEVGSAGLDAHPGRRVANVGRSGDPRNVPRCAYLIDLGSANVVAAEVRCDCGARRRGHSGGARTTLVRPGHGCGGSQYAEDRDGCGGKNSAAEALIHVRNVARTSSRDSPS